MVTDLVKARDDAVRDLANHIQPTQCGGCDTCALLWRDVAEAERQLALSQVAA